MNAISVRITLQLAVLPAAVVAFALFAAGELRDAMLAGVAFVLLATAVIWARVIAWTPARLFVSLALGAAALAPLALWKLLPATGYIDDLIRWAECALVLGLCLGGWMLLGRRPRDASVAVRPREGSLPRMTPNVTRLMLGFALMPLLPGVFFVTAAAAFEFFGPREMGVFAAYELCAALAVLIWFLVWRRGVAWTARTRIATGLLAAVLLASPSAVFFADRVRGLSIDLEMVCWVAPVLAYALWLAGSAFAWRTRGAAVDPRATPEEVHCPRCGYNLRGLHEVRCPECGWTATVDELVRLALAVRTNDP